MAICTHAMLTKLELEKTNSPPINVLKKITEILEVPLEELLREDEEVVTTKDLLNDSNLTLFMY